MKKIMYVMLAILLVGGGGIIAGNLFAPRAEAQRIVVIDGDVYRASDLYRSERLTNSKDIRMLFEEKNGMMLVGKGYEGVVPESEIVGGTQLYLYRNDGTKEQAVSEKSDVVHTLFDKGAEHVVYLTREGYLEIYDITTGEKKRIAMEASLPRLSPDGKFLVYEKTPPGWGPGQSFEGAPGFAILNIETGEEKIIPNTDVPSRTGDDYAPLWTPDGKHIIFFSDGIYMINLDGTERTQITNKPGAYADSGEMTPGISGDPLWSSDGKYFLYHSDYVVWVIELDLVGKRLISARPIAEGVGPRWIEEGRTISVLAQDAKAGDVAVTTVDLQGNVIRGDKSKGKNSPRIQSERRMPIPSLPHEQSNRAMPQELIEEQRNPKQESNQNTQTPDLQKQVPGGPIIPITQ